MYQRRASGSLFGACTRGHEIISMPPSSSGGIALVQMLNILEGYDLSGKRIRFGPERPLGRGDHAQGVRRPSSASRGSRFQSADADRPAHVEGIRAGAAANHRFESRPSKSSPTTFSWPQVSTETTHFSVVDAQRNAVALTYTLEQGYGSRIVVPGAGFLLNNEMGVSTRPRNSQPMKA